METSRPMQNRVFLMRHGQSEANIQSILISEPEVGISSYGLTEEGRKQAEEAANELHKEFSNFSEDILSEKIVIISSDFKRTRETAEVVHKHFSLKAPVVFDARLRERRFGNFEEKPEHSYMEIVTLDSADPTQSKDGCESLMSLVSRTCRVLQDMDREYQDKILILISHGDPLITLFAVCLGIPPNERIMHCQSFSNCEFREVY